MKECKFYCLEKDDKVDEKSPTVEEPVIDKVSLYNSVEQNSSFLQLELHVRITSISPDI